MRRGLSALLGVLLAPHIVVVRTVIPIDADER